MKKELSKKLVLVILLVFFILLVLVWQHKKQLTKNKDNQSATEKVLVDSSTYEIKKIEENNELTVISVSYPYFKLAPLEFNTRIETILRESIKEHKEISTENWSARDNTAIKNVLPTQEDKWPFNAHVVVVQSNEDYISCVVTYGGFSGGAHGYQTQVSYAFDVKKQKEIKLDDLFLNTPNFLEYISDNSRIQLKKEYAVIREEDIINSSKEALGEYMASMVNDIVNGTEPKEENFNVFTFDDSKLTIYFNPYQVGPYAIGSPTVIIDRK